MRPRFADKQMIVDECAECSRRPIGSRIEVEAQFFTPVLAFQFPHPNPLPKGARGPYRAHIIIIINNERLLKSSLVSATPSLSSTEIRH